MHYVTMFTRRQIYALYFQINILQLKHIILKRIPQSNKNSLNRTIVYYTQL